MDSGDRSLRRDAAPSASSANFGHPAFPASEFLEQMLEAEWGVGDYQVFPSGTIYRREKKTGALHKMPKKLKELLEQEAALKPKRSETQ